MAAELKLYTTADCDVELSGGDPYTLQIGTASGLDGTDGETYVTSIWAKNTGTILLSAVALTETSDTDARGSYSLDGVTYNTTTITLGEMAITGATQIVRIYIKITVAASTAVHVDEPLNFTISGTYLS